MNRAWLLTWRCLRLPVAGVLVIGLAASGCGGEARVVGEAGAKAARHSYKAPATGITGGGASVTGGCASSTAC